MSLYLDKRGRVQENTGVSSVWIAQDSGDQIENDRSANTSELASLFPFLNPVSQVVCLDDPRKGRFRKEIGAEKAS